MNQIPCFRRKEKLYLLHDFLVCSSLKMNIRIIRISYQKQLTRSSSEENSYSVGRSHTKLTKSKSQNRTKFR